MTVDHHIALCVKIWSALHLLYTFNDIGRIHKFLLSSNRLFDAVPNCSGQLELTLLKCEEYCGSNKQLWCCLQTNAGIGTLPSAVFCPELVG